MKKWPNLMNKNFVSIKVDREERPDIDHIYQTFRPTYRSEQRLALERDHLAERQTAIWGYLSYQRTMEQSACPDI